MKSVSYIGDVHELEAKGVYMYKCDRCASVARSTDGSSDTFECALCHGTCRRVK